eukprot:271521_1
MSQRPQRFILFIFGITFVSYVYYDLFIITHLHDHAKNHNQPVQIIPIEDTNRMHSIPSLMILGPPKTGTTSLLANLAYYFPNWHHQHRRPNGGLRENTHWYNGLRQNVIRNRSRLRTFYQRLRRDMQSNYQISKYDFNALLTDDIWPQTNILTMKSQFIEHITKKLHITNNKTYIHVEKTAFNYYLFHLALVFRRYLSSTQFNHNRRGTKMLAILRDPGRRLISWYSMKIKFKPRQTLDHLIVNASSANNSVVMEFRDLIMNRKNEYDDTKIMLKYVEWMYVNGGEPRHRPWPNMWLSSDMLMFGVEYPVLLFWIYAYEQVGLGDYFKVIRFDYMVKHFKQVMHWIRCWVEQDITDAMQCDAHAMTHYVDVNDSIVFERMNHYGETQGDDLMHFVNEFYKPFKQQTALLLQRTDVVLGVLE